MKKISKVQVGALVVFLASLGLMWFSFSKGYSYSYGYLILTVMSVVAFLFGPIKTALNVRLEAGLTEQASADTLKETVPKVGLFSRMLLFFPNAFSLFWSWLMRYVSTRIEQLSDEFLNEQGGHLEKGWFTRFLVIFGASVVVFLVFVLFVIGASLLSYHLGGALYGHSKTAFYITHSLLLVAFVICTAITIAVCVAISRAWKDYIGQHSFIASVSGAVGSVLSFTLKTAMWVLLGAIVPLIHYIVMLSRGQPDFPDYFFATIILVITSYITYLCVWGEVKIYLEGVSPEFRRVIDPVEFRPGEDIPWRPKKVQFRDDAEGVSVSTTMALEIEEHYNGAERALFQAVQEAEIERYNSKVRKARKELQVNFGLSASLVALGLSLAYAFFYQGGFDVYFNELERSIVSISLLISIVTFAAIAIRGAFTKLAVDGDVVADGQTGVFVADEVAPGLQTHDDFPALNGGVDHSVLSQSGDHVSPGSSVEVEAADRSDHLKSSIVPKVLLLAGYVVLITAGLFFAAEFNFSAKELWMFAFASSLVFIALVYVFVVSVGAFALPLSQEGWNAFKHHYDGVGIADFLKYHTGSNMLVLQGSNWRELIHQMIKKVWEANNGWGSFEDMDSQLNTGELSDIDVDVRPLELMLRYDEAIRGYRSFGAAFMCLVAGLCALLLVYVFPSVFLSDDISILSGHVLAAFFLLSALFFFLCYIWMMKMQEIEEALLPKSPPTYTPDINREKISGKLQLLKEDVAVLRHVGEKVRAMKRFMASAIGGVVVRVFMTLGFLWRIFEACAWIFALMYLVVVGFSALLQRGSEWWLKAQVALSWYHSWYALIPLTGYMLLLLHRRFLYEFKLLPDQKYYRTRSSVGDHYRIEGWTAMWDEKDLDYCLNVLRENDIPEPAYHLSRDAWIRLFEAYRNIPVNQGGDSVGMGLDHAELERPSVSVIKNAQLAYQAPWRRLAVMVVLVGITFASFFFVNRKQTKSPLKSKPIVAKANIERRSFSPAPADSSLVKKLRKQLAQAKRGEKTALAVLKPLFAQCNMELSLEALSSADSVAKQLAECLKVKKGVNGSWFRRQYRKAQRNLRQARSRQRKLQSKIVRLQKEKKASDANLRRKISGLASQVRTLRSAKSHQGQRITRLAGELQKVRSEKVSLQAKLIAQRGKLAAVKTAKGRLEGRVASLKRKLTGQKALALKKAKRARRTRLRAERLARKKRLAAARRKARRARAKRAALLKKRRRARALTRKRRLARKKRSRKRGGSAQDGLW